MNVIDMKAWLLSKKPQWKNFRGIEDYDNAVSDWHRRHGRTLARIEAKLSLTETPERDQAPTLTAKAHAEHLLGEPISQEAWERDWQPKPSLSMLKLQAKQSSSDDKPNLPEN